MRRLLIPVILLVGAFPLSCARSPSAASRGGQFRLASIDGRAVPMVRDRDSLCVDSVVAGRVDLAPAPDSGEASYRWTERAIDGCGQHQSPADWDRAGTYFVRRDTLRFRTTPDGFVMWRGQVRGDTLVIQQDHWRGDFMHGAHEYRFLRLRDPR